MEERWLPVVGFESYYEVSNRGRVCSLGRWVGTRWGPETRWKPAEILTPLAGRYPQVTLCTPGGKQRKSVHLLVLEAFVGPCPPGLEGCHDNDDGFNNR